MEIEKKDYESNSKTSAKSLSKIQRSCKCCEDCKCCDAYGEDVKSSCCKKIVTKKAIKTIECFCSSESKSSVPKCCVIVKLPKGSGACKCYVSCGDKFKCLCYEKSIAAEGGSEGCCCDAKGGCKCCTACGDKSKKCECGEDCKCCCCCIVTDSCKGTHEDVKQESSKGCCCDAKGSCKCCTACGDKSKKCECGEDCKCCCCCIVTDSCKGTHEDVKQESSKGCCCDAKGSCKCCTACGDESKECECGEDCKCCRCCITTDSCKGIHKDVKTKDGSGCICCVSCGDTSIICKCDGECKCCIGCTKDMDTKFKDACCLVNVKTSEKNIIVKCYCNSSKSCNIVVDLTDPGNCKCCVACNDDSKDCKCTGECKCCTDCSGQTGLKKSTESTCAC